jgi:Tol biopolymer transport system component
VAPQEARAATRSSLFVASADGSGARAVVSAEAPNVFYHWPTWDAAGTHLYALRADADGARIERIDIASGERRPVVDRAADFDVSRVGRLIAFVRNADAGATLNLARRDVGGAPQTLVSARPFQTIAAPRFTSDGSTVLFSLSRPPEGEASTQAKPQSAYRDGVRLALAHGLPQDIYSVPVEGGPLRLVVRLGADDPVATWSPDGGRVAVLTLSSLGITSPAGSIVPILAPGGYGSIDWAP